TRPPAVAWRDDRGMIGKGAHVDDDINRRACAREPRRTHRALTAAHEQSAPVQPPADTHGDRMTAITPHPGAAKQPTPSGDGMNPIAYFRRDIPFASELGTALVVWHVILHRAFLLLSA